MKSRNFIHPNNILVKTAFIVLISLSFKIGYTPPLLAQDIIVLQSGEEFDVKIISKKGPYIMYTLWEDQEGEVKEIRKKFLKRHRMDYLTKERVSFSFSLGGVPYGTSTNLKNYMKDNGYDGSSNGFFGTTQYPVAHVKVSWILGFEYLIKPPHGFSIEFAQTNRGYVQGLVPAGYDWLWNNYTSGVTPEIHYANPQLSASYKYYFKSYKSNLQAGFILNNTRIWESLDDEKVNKNSKLSGGILIGYAGSLVEKEVFFMRFQAQFRYIIPFEVTNSDSFLYGEKIGLSHVFIGIQTGIKIATNK